MRYVSTRGGAPEVDFTTALLAGLAPDGGLYVPVEWPVLSEGRIATFGSLPYAEVAADILKRFAGDALTIEACREATSAAYSSFAHPAVTPLRQLDHDIWLLELFHGPTLAFKDVAMQLLARLYDRALAERGRKLTIVCATSGDTGGAAVEAFRGSPHVDLVVLFPHGRISEVQRRFMTAATEPNVRCVAVDGTFDDCQAIVKALFADRAFAAEVDLSGVNSINWARIVAQSVYYFTAATALGGPVRRVNFTVPTGNFGDAFAGYAAHKMGLPIEGITVATNANDIVARAIRSGEYRREAVVATQSPAMDIQVASNFERLYFEAVNRDGSQVSWAFEGFAATGRLDLSQKVMDHVWPFFSAIAASEEQTSRQIRYVFTSTGELVDPHTAVALAATPGGRGEVNIVLSTAHPAKFPEAVQAAAGVHPALPARVGDLFARAERITHLPADIEAIKAFVKEAR